MTKSIPRSVGPLGGITGSYRPYAHSLQVPEETAGPYRFLTGIPCSVGPSAAEGIKPVMRLHGADRGRFVFFSYLMEDLVEVEWPPVFNGGWPVNHVSLNNRRRTRITRRRNVPALSE